jgi:hypothetical protein
MIVKIDFSLGNRFGVVEQTVFRLLLNGVTNTVEISNLLWLFSDEVIANAFINLVNQQIVQANVKSQSLSLSDSVTALIETCLNKSFEVEIPEMLITTAVDNRLLFTDTVIKETILSQLLPNIKLSFLASVLDFTIIMRGETNE